MPGGSGPVTNVPGATASAVMGMVVVMPVIIGWAIVITSPIKGWVDCPVIVTRPPVEAGIGIISGTGSAIIGTIVITAREEHRETAESDGKKKEGYLLLHNPQITTSHPTLASQNFDL